MAAQARRVHPGPGVNFANEIPETLIAKTEDSSLTADNIHRLVEDLSGLLGLAEDAASELPAATDGATLAQVSRELQSAVVSVICA